jgi:hypothetical protein
VCKTCAAIVQGRQHCRLCRELLARGLQRNPATGLGNSRFSEQKTEATIMIRKLASGEYRLYSRKKNPKTGRRRNLGTFATRAAAEKHERDVQYFKHH